MNRKNLKTLMIGGTPFMLRSHTEGMNHVNIQQALANRPLRFQNDTIAARTNKPDPQTGVGPLDVAQDVGGFENQLIGTPEQIRDHMLNGDYDLVRIVTPDRDHSFYAIPALEAGIHVFCEKGLSHTLEDGKRMVEAAAKGAAKGAVAVLEYNYPGLDAVARFRQLVAEGKVVNLEKRAYAGIIRFLQDWGIKDRSNWRFNYELCGLIGVLGDLGTHIFRAMLWCLESLDDEVVSVEGTVTYYDGFGDDLRLLGPEDVDTETRAVDASTFTLNMKSGSRITGETGRHYRISKADMGLQLFGNPGGKLRWDLADPAYYGFSQHNDNGDVGETRVLMSDFVPGLSAGFHTGHGNVDLAVLRWIEDGQNGPCPGTTFEQGLHCLQIAEAIRQAGIKHRRVAMSEVAV